MFTRDLVSTYAYLYVLSPVFSTSNRRVWSAALAKTQATRAASTIMNFMMKKLKFLKFLNTEVYLKKIALTIMMLCQHFHHLLYHNIFTGVNYS